MDGISADGQSVLHCAESDGFMRKGESLKRTFVLLMSIVGLLFNVAGYAYVWTQVYHRNLVWNVKFTFWGHVLMVCVYGILLFFFAASFGGLKIGYLKVGDVFFAQLFAILIDGVITFFQISLMENRLVYSVPMLWLLLCQVVASFVWVVLCDRLYIKLFPPRKLLLIYGVHAIDDIVSKFDTRKNKYNIVKCINISEGIDKVKEEAQNPEYNGVIIWDIPTAVRNNLLKFCYSRNIRMYMMPKISDVIIKGSDQLHLFDTPVLLTREYALKVEQRFFKRCIDIICSVILLIILSPIMLITAIIIKVQDGGPVLYKQIRCTINAREFRIMKFRSMRVDAEKDGVARLATKNDSRITPYGKFIRATRIDEIPQLINILKGDMSFIGPRPERPEIIKQYMEEMPEFAFRMKVKAGLAGYAQVYGKYNTTPYDKLKLDLTYIENYSVWLDIQLMILTIKILFTPDATEGVDNSQLTAMKKEASDDINM